jgi:hypothetical protein
MKLLEENIGEALEDVGIGNDYLKRTPVAQKVRARTDKWGCVKLGGFCTAQETMTRVKREWEKIFVSSGLLSRTH